MLRRRQSERVRERDRAQVLRCHGSHQSVASGGQMERVRESERAREREIELKYSVVMAFTTVSEWPLLGRSRERERERSTTYSVDISPDTHHG